MNTNRLPIDTSDADRHTISPSPGDTIVTDDGREGTVTKVSWLTKDGHLTTATVTTGAFECSIGEVSLIVKKVEEEK